LLERFARAYQQGQAPAMLGIERRVCGCDYGGTSWTTKDEAEQVGRLLQLDIGKRLLDLGAGSGWPGLFLAQRRRCDVALVDVPLEGLRIAAERAAADRLSGSAWAVCADGACLPFGNGNFDAIEHSDVLCCLEAKSAVLKECRRLIRSAGRMVFSVISIAPSLSRAEHERATAAGPPFKAVSSDYPRMLQDAGWRLIEAFDLTTSYATCVGQRLAAEEAQADALIAILGEGEFADLILRRRRAAEASASGLLRRELFAALSAG
jgi:SAM-dependent methyltransferase